MATVTHAATAIWSTTGGNVTSNSFTPSVSDLIIVVAPATGVASTVVTDNNTDNRGVYVKIGSSFTGWSTSGDLSIWVRTALVEKSVATTVSVTQTASTGGGVDVFRVSGMTRSGLLAIRSSGGQSAGTLGTTPAPVLSLTPLTGNPIITAVCNGTSPAGVTQPTSYTQATNLGYATPTSGLDTAFINSGITNATITWGSTSATAFGSVAIELDTSAPPSGPVFIEQNTWSPVKAKLPAALASYAGTPLGYGRFYGSTAPGTAENSAATGRISWNSGAPVNNPTSGPPLGWDGPAGLRVTVLRVGSCLASSQVSPFPPPAPVLVVQEQVQPVAAAVRKLPPRGTCQTTPPFRRPNNPTPGPPFTQKPYPVQAPDPLQTSYPGARAFRGRVYSNLGTIPPAAQPAPFFAKQAVRARLPQVRLPAGEQVNSNPGAPVRNPTAGPVIRSFLARARIAQNAPRGRTYSSSGAPLRNPTAGPVFRQLPWPVQAADPLPRRGRVYFTPVRVPGPVAPFRQATQPVRARIPQLRLPANEQVNSLRGAPVRNPTSGPPLNTFLSRPRILQNAPRGRIYSSPGAQLRNPTSGPVFRQLPWPVQAPDPLPRRGRTASNAGTIFIPPPSTTGPPFYPATQPVRSRVPQNAPRGRVYSGTGAPVRNPTLGPVFRQATQPVRARVPQNWSKGRVYANLGAPVFIPAFTAPFRQAVQPARARQPLPLRGRVYGSQGAPVRNSTSGPVFIQATQPVRARIPQNSPRGRITFNAGVRIAVIIPAPLYPPQGPARARIPQNWSKGRAYFGPGAPVRNPTSGPQIHVSLVRPRIPQNGPRGRVYSNPGTFFPGRGPVFRQATSPSRARIPQNGPRGRIWSGKGVLPPVPFIPAIAYLLGRPVQARRPLPLKGRTYSNPGAPVRNPTQGPRFIQAVQPARKRIPQNAPRGRTSSNIGAPIHNIPLSAPFFKLGLPYLEWIVGQPYEEWRAGEPFPYSDWGAGEPYLDWLTGVPYQEWDTGEPYGS